MSKTLQISALIYGSALKLADGNIYRYIKKDSDDNCIVLDLTTGQQITLKFTDTVTALEDYELPDEKNTTEIQAQIVFDSPK